MNTKITMAELESVAAEWQPMPHSVLGRVLAACRSAVTVRDEEQIKMAQIGTEITTLEHARAAAVAAGDVEAAATAESRLTGATAIQTDTRRKLAAANESLAAAVARRDELLGELNGAARKESAARAELGKLHGELQRRISSLTEVKRQILM